MNFERQSENIKFPKIASELKEMSAVDQDMRVRSQTEGYWDTSVDARHTERMKEIVNEIGWPTISKVGEVGSDDAYLLVQHADHDVEFQRECLELMKQASDSEVNRKNIAYLEDRTRVNLGQKQVYGTQFNQEDGKHIPCPIKDEEHVNERLATMGMGTLQDLIDEMYEQYPFDTSKDL